MPCAGWRTTSGLLIAKMDRPLVFRQDVQPCRSPMAGLLVRTSSGPISEFTAPLCAEHYKATAPQEFSGWIPIDTPEFYQRHPTRVVNLRDKSEVFDIYIGRGRSELRAGLPDFGNPWGCVPHAVTEFHCTGPNAREESIRCYERWFKAEPGFYLTLPQRRTAILQALPRLRGRVLACYCKPQPCHGDVLARLADALGAQDPQAVGQARSRVLAARQVQTTPLTGGSHER